MNRRISRVIWVALACAGFSRACSWDYKIWIPREPTADALYRFTKSGKAGYIDRSGKVVIQPAIRSYGNGGGEFHDGRLEIGGSDGIYVDSTGRKVIDMGLYRGWAFSEGLAVAAAREHGPWGYINTEGEFAIPPKFEWGPDNYVWSFEGGLAKIEVNGRYGYIDHSGAFVIQPTLLDGDSFHEDLARVVLEGPCAYTPREYPCGGFNVQRPGVSWRTPSNSGERLPACKFAFIEKSGRVISDKRYDYALYFSEGLAPVLIGTLWGYIDKTGELVIPARFEKAEPFSDGLALVRENELYGFIDQRGSYAVAPQFELAESFSDGRAPVGSRDGPWWYIDHEGKQAFPRKFAVGSSFFKGLAHVQLLPPKEGSKAKPGFEYIDTDGRTVFAYTP